MGCKCYEDLNENFIKQDLKIDHVDFQEELLSGRHYEKATIHTKNGKKRSVNILCGYCPHCGRKYSEEEKQKNSEAAKHYLDQLRTLVKKGSRT